MMTKAVRYTMGGCAILGLGFILWFPKHTICSLIGYLLITLSVLIQYIAFKKEQKKKK